MGFGSFLCLLKAEAGNNASVTQEKEVWNTAASRLTAVHERCSLMICIRFKSDRDTKILHATTCGMLYAHTSIGEESSALNVQSGGFFHSFSQFRRSIYFNFFNIFNISHKSREVSCPWICIKTLWALIRRLNATECLQINVGSD